MFTNLLDKLTMHYIFKYMTAIIIEISLMTIITQSYEWFVMWNVIMWQKEKSLGEMLYLLDSEEISKFQKSEKWILVFYVILMIVLIVFRFSQRLSFLFYRFQPGEEVDTVMLYLYGLVICLILTSTFALLVFQLKKYH